MRIIQNGKGDFVAIKYIKPLTIQTVTNMKTGVIGRIYKNVTINSMTPSSVDVSFKGGAAGIKFSDMTPQSKKLFIKDRKAEKKYHKMLSAAHSKLREKNKRFFPENILILSPGKPFLLKERGCPSNC